MMLSPDLIVMLAGVITGMIGTHLEAKRKQAELMIAKDAEFLKAAREDKNHIAAVTRLVIASTVVFSVILLPKLAPILLNTPVQYGILKEGASWVWGFFSFGQTLSFTDPQIAVQITPIDIQFCLAVAGFYLGYNRR